MRVASLLAVLLIISTGVLGHGKLEYPPPRGNVKFTNDILRLPLTNKTALLPPGTNVETCGGLRKSDSDVKPTSVTPGQQLNVIWEIGYWTGSGLHQGNITIELSRGDADQSPWELLGFLSFNGADTAANTPHNMTVVLPNNLPLKSSATLRWTWKAALNSEVFVLCADLSTCDSAQAKQLAAPQITCPPIPASTSTTCVTTTQTTTRTVKSTIVNTVTQTTTATTTSTVTTILPSTTVITKTETSVQPCATSTSQNRAGPTMTTTPAAKKLCKPKTTAVNTTAAAPVVTTTPAAPPKTFYIPAYEVPKPSTAAAAPVQTTFAYAPAMPKAPTTTRAAAPSTTAAVGYNADDETEEEREEDYYEKELKKKRKREDVFEEL
ncbi:hypothetical protein HDV05_000469 [Chytridiales sp. JEL 0842]|nr:hypothetical protein HDV05_000469 [Chytridiales sp. JEL 0842]